MFTKTKNCPRQSLVLVRCKIVFFTLNSFFNGQGAAKKKSYSSAGNMLKNVLRKSNLMKAQFSTVVENTVQDTVKKIPPSVKLFDELDNGSLIVALETYKHHVKDLSEVDHHRAATKLINGFYSENLIKAAMKVISVGRAAHQFVPEEEMYYRLVHAAIDDGHHKMARRLLNWMFKDNQEISNRLIDSYLNLAETRPDDVCWIAHQLLETPDMELQLSVLHTVLYYCAKVRPAAVKEAMALFEKYMEQLGNRGEPPYPVINKLAQVVGRSKYSEVAMRLLNHHQSMITYTSAISACMNNQQYEQVIDIVRNMQSSTFEVNCNNLAKYLVACNELQHYDEVIRVYESDQFDPQIRGAYWIDTTCKAVADSYINSGGQFERAQEVLESFHIDPNNVFNRGLMSVLVIIKAHFNDHEWISQLDSYGLPAPARVALSRYYNRMGNDRLAEESMNFAKNLNQWTFDSLSYALDFSFQRNDFPAVMRYKNKGMFLKMNESLHPKLFPFDSSISTCEESIQELQQLLEWKMHLIDNNVQISAPWHTTFKFARVRLSKLASLNKPEERFILQ